MQYYTPIQSGGQAHSGNPFSETQPSCRPPQIIGEGDVASFVLPDGSIQLYFVPRCPPGPHYPSFLNQLHSPWNSYPEAWFIRSVPDQLLACPNVSRPQCQPENSNPSFLQSRFQSRTGYQLKFHNDACTSTTDIHYFDSALRPRECLPRQTAATQAASPPCTPPSEASRPVSGHPCHCEKPCHCFNSYGRTDQIHNIFVGTNFDTEKRKIMQIPYSECQTVDRAPSVEIIHDKVDKKQKKMTRFGDRHSKCECGCDSASPARARAAATATATGGGGLARATQTRCAGGALRRAGSFLAAAELWRPASPAARRALAAPSDASLDASLDASDA